MNAKYQAVIAKVNGIEWGKITFYKEMKRGIGSIETKEILSFADGKNKQLTNEINKKI